MNRQDCVIVCGIDGSAAGRQAVEWAFKEALRRGCRLRAVTVWSWDGPDYGLTTGSAEEARARAVTVQDQVLAEIVGDRQEPRVERVVAEGRPSEQLCLAGRDAELLVLGSHGHGAFHDALVGSTSQHVIRHAPCPVVVVPDENSAGRERTQVKARHQTARSQGAPMF